MIMCAARAHPAEKSKHAYEETKLAQTITLADNAHFRTPRSAACATQLLVPLISGLCTSTGRGLHTCLVPVSRYMTHAGAFFSSGYRPAYLLCYRQRPRSTPDLSLSLTTS